MFRHALAAAALTLAPMAFAGSAEEIAAAVQSYEETFNAGDAAGLAMQYTEYGIAHAPGWKVVSGRDGLERMYTAFFKAGFSDLRSEPDTLETEGDMAVETYVVTTTRTDGDGAKTDHSYKELRVWKRGDDGAWRVHRLSFNSMPGA